MTTKQDVQSALDGFKKAVEDFAQPRETGGEVMGPYGEHTGIYETVVNGEGSLVGHIFGALDNVVQPLIDELQGRGVTPPAPSDG